MTTFRYAIAVTIIVIIATLVWWYFMLRAQTNAIANDDQGRGAGQETPSFGNSVGSTYQNIVSSATSFLGGGKSKSKTLGRLAELSTTPTAGAGFVTVGTSTSVRFVERSTGYILDADVVDGSLTRLTNTLTPRIYQAFVGERHIIMQALEDNGGISTTVATVSATSSNGSAFVMTKRLPDGIRTVALSPEEEEIAYVGAGEGGEVVGTRRDIASGKEKQIFSSLISGWHIEWLPSDRIILQQAPSTEATGYVYEVKKDETLQPLVRGGPGLTLRAHPTLRAFLFGYVQSGLTLFARATDEATTLTLPLRTVPEKCVWRPSSAKASEGAAGESLVAFCAVPQSLPALPFLDGWYRGEIHTADAWWRVDVSANTAEIVYSPGDISLDVEKPLIDKDGNYITFLNRLDKSLWLLRIAN